MSVKWFQKCKIFQERKIKPACTDGRDINDLRLFYRSLTLYH